MAVENPTQWMIWIEDSSDLIIDHLLEDLSCILKYTFQDTGNSYFVPNPHWLSVYDISFEKKKY